MKNNQPLVSVLILTYNRTDLLKACLDSVLKSNYPNLNIIVSDNCSSDDIKGFVKRTYPKNSVKVYKKSINNGLTGGFNFGYQYCKGKYVMLLCNDTSVNKSTISELVNIAENDSKVGAVAPLVTQMKFPELVHSAGSFLTWTGLLYHFGVYKKKDRQAYKDSYYIFSATGAGFLVRSETIKKTGLYSEDFFMAFDESDLCHRIWLSGYTIVYCPKSELKHLWSATMNSSKPILWYWNQRNVISSIIFNHSFPFMLVLLININIIFWFWWFYRIYQGNFGHCWTLPRAYLWHILNFNKTISRRREVQEKIRKVTDNEIFNLTMVNPSWRYYLLHLGRKFSDAKLPSRIIYHPIHL